MIINYFPNIFPHRISLKKVLFGELALIFCFSAVAVLNNFNAETIVYGGPPPLFWIISIANTYLCIYGLIRRDK